MRIIAGALKGMKLLAPKGGETTRPTSSKVREAILHKITEDLEDAVFVDVFSGTGAVGLEALSRGARGCYFVEKDFSTSKILRKNMELACERLQKQGIYPSPYKVLCLPAEKALPALKNSHAEASWVLWADPPYATFFGWLKTFSPEKLSFYKNLELIVMELDSEDLNKIEFCLDGWEKNL